MTTDCAPEKDVEERPGPEIEHESGVPTTPHDTVAESPWRTVDAGFMVRVISAGFTVTVTLEDALLVPFVQVMSYDVVTAGDTVTDPTVALPVENLVLVHEVVYEDVQSIRGEVTPLIMVLGVAVISTVGVFCIVPVTQVAVTELVPDVTITEADFVPAVLYVFEAVELVPESPSVPLHTYVYEPTPPEGVTAQVNESPT